MTNLASRSRPKAVAAPNKRVAVYTRKSVSEGLQQEFNSLDAQREAVEAYALSQRGEGWAVLPEQYNDGGYSGSNVDRPAFQRLMRDVEAGKVDVIAVYKIDRLSRSLADFARLMETFERHGVSCVSITQQFNSTTSMGRLTLNILMSFAVFERETIAERTRDKIAATRRKGLWTGGRPVLGYDVVNKRLVVNAEEAERVKHVFALYLQLGSLIMVASELNSQGWTTKSWVTQEGKHIVGFPFTKSSVRDMLRNPLYRGKIKCGEELVEGVHDAIIDERTWDAVQAQMHANLVNPAPRLGQTKSAALLSGLLRCKCGSSMTYHYTQRGEKRYQYYVCLRGEKRGAHVCRGRAPAPALEQLVLDRLRAVGRDPALLDATLQADRADRDARRPELVALVRRVDAEQTRLEGERGNIVEAIAKGATSLVGQLAEHDQRLAEGDQRAQDARRDLAALDLDTVGMDELRARLEDLGPLWAELFPKERTRLLRLLVERMVFDHESGELVITLRPPIPARRLHDRVSRNAHGRALLRAFRSEADRAVGASDCRPGADRRPTSTEGA